MFRHRTHYLLAERGVEIVGVLPLAQIKSLLFGTFACFAAIRRLRRYRRASDEEAAQTLHTAAVELARELRCRSISNLRNVARRAGLAACAGPVRHAFASARSPTSRPTCCDRASSARWCARARSAACSEIDRDVDRFSSSMPTTCIGHGTPPMSKRYFESAAQAFGDDCEVHDCDTPARTAASGVLCRSTSATKSCRTTPATVAEARELAANDFKYWELMRRACERGCPPSTSAAPSATRGRSTSRRTGASSRALHYEYRCCAKACRRTIRRIRSTRLTGGGVVRGERVRNARWAIYVRDKIPRTNALEHALSTESLSAGVTKGASWSRCSSV